MPDVTYESIGDSLSRLPEVIRSIPDIVRDPSANPLQAAILLGIVVTIVLIVLVALVILVMRPSAEDEYVLAEEGGEAVEEVASTPPVSWLTVAGVAILVLAGLWVAVGVTTSAADVCSSCHGNSSHAQAGSADPHASVACVSCHETGGSVARVTVNVLTRVRHVVVARLHSLSGKGYGKPSASDACARCHREEISGVFNDRARGVRISHKEPMAAGAQCVDCHALEAGVVGSVTNGMAPCLRCHNGKTASAECSACHTGDPSGAIRAQVANTTMASELVANPQCDGCHFDMSTCDACHGIRMPHSLEFRTYRHARDAAVDIWDNGRVTVCAKCHYPGHDNCQQFACHSAPFPSHGSPTWREDHKGATWSGSARACSCHNWNEWDHNGMNYCEICHPVKPPVVRP